MRDSKFQTALRRWLDVLLQLPPNCGIVVQLKQVGDTSHQLRMLRDIFAKKAPQTLLKRCHSFLRFVCHLKDVGETFPGTEQASTVSFAVFVMQVRPRQICRVLCRL